MLPPNTPMALAPLPCTEFVEFVLRHHTAPTTLIICSSREAFLQDLQTSIDHAHPRDPAADPKSDGPSVDDTTHPAPHHPLLVPTIHLIARSSSVALAFAPTVSHLRAYVATHTIDAKPEPTPSTTWAKPGFQYPMLAVWGLASLHRSTAEHSAQGLSRSLAAIVETAKLNGQRLLLAESLNLNAEVESADIGSVDDPWKEQVPLLSGTVRFRGEDRVWAGKTVAVGSVVAKWCRFVIVSDDI